MDSLTSRFLSRTGLNPANPTLPPVHNMRMVYLREPLTEAEKDLHIARKAHKALEVGQASLKADPAANVNIQALSTDLYDAMFNLEEREQEHFQRRYIVDNRPAIQGWGPRKFTMVMDETFDALLRMNVPTFLDSSDSEDEEEAQYVTNTRQAASEMRAMGSNLKTMNDLCYDDVGKRRPILPTRQIGIQHNNLIRSLDRLHGLLKSTRELASSRGQEGALAQITTWEEVAVVMLQMAESIVNNKWNLPKS